MGRKIPGRKHRGVRDPEKQRLQRLDSIKNKINAPPLNPDEQHIPKSVQRIIELRNRVRNGEFTTKRKKKIINHKKQFEQFEGESDNRFLHRVNMICEEVKREVAYETKYGVEIKKNKETGEIEQIVKRPKDELVVLINKNKKQQKNGSKKSKVKENNEPRLTKSQKRQLKLKEKKQKKTEQKLNKRDEVQKDMVGFGEIVHAPPTLTAPKKFAEHDTVSRPGQRQLLLKSYLNQNKGNDSDKKLHSTINKVIDRKGKRKDMPNSLRRQLDAQQKEIIEAYKLIKSKKYQKA